MIDQLAALETITENPPGFAWEMTCINRRADRPRRSEDSRNSRDSADLPGKPDFYAFSMTGGGRRMSSV